jgi:hypothetical protein
MNGEKIYEYAIPLGDTVEYGSSLAAILAGDEKPPLHGARFDGPFEGRIDGRLSGTIRGCDFAFMRSDGVLELNIHARIDTVDGARIALSAGGIGRFRPDEPILDLAENVRLTTSYKAYDWVNGRQIWATGTVDLGAGTISLQGFMQ